MTARELSHEEYRRLLGVTRAAVYDELPPSAAPNIGDQIVSETIEQYLQALQAGKEIRNPFAWVPQRARWRAMDQKRKWTREKKRTRAYNADERDEHTDALLAEIGQAIRSAGGEDDRTPSSLVASREWVRELIYGAYPTDTTNRQLAIACLVEGAKPREVAEEFDMDAKVIGNRLVRIRAKLLAQLSTSESP